MVIDEALRSTTARPVPLRRSTWVTTALGLLVAVLAGGGLALGLAMRALSLVSEPAPPTVDALVEVAVCALGALVAFWLAASALLALGCLTTRLVGSSWRLGERLVHRWAPAVVRRALVLALAATVGLGTTTGASADPSPAPDPTLTAVRVAADDLGWIVTTPAGRAPTREAGPAAAPPSVAPPPPQAHPVLLPVVPPAATPVVPAAPSEPEPNPAPPRSAADSRRVVVAAGDSLWAIAARHLAPDATDAQIAASWPRWYEANTTVIGPDPSLIVPGQELVAPASHDGATP